MKTSANRPVRTRSGAIPLSNEGQIPSRALASKGVSKKVRLKRWKRRHNPRPEDKLLKHYCEKGGGITYTEVPIGIGEEWSNADSERRYLDGVRIVPASQEEALAEIISFTTNRSVEFNTSIKGMQVEPPGYWAGNCRREYFRGRI